MVHPRFLVDLMMSVNFPSSQHLVRGHTHPLSLKLGGWRTNA